MPSITVTYGGRNDRPSGLCASCRIFSVHPPAELCARCQARAEQRVASVRAMTAELRRLRAELTPD